MPGWGGLPSYGDVLGARSVLRGVLVDMIYQFAYRNGHGWFHSGGLSVLEEAFRIVGLPDPCPPETLDSTDWGEE